MRPDGAEKWVGCVRLPREVTQDVSLAEAVLDRSARSCAESQGVALVERISTGLHPRRWVVADDGSTMAEACAEEDADHHLAVMKWWAFPPTDRPCVELPRLPDERIPW